MRFTAQIDAHRATDEFKAARRDLNRRTRDGLKTAGENVALPEAKRRAPHKTGRLRSRLVVKATSRRAYLTTSLRGKAGRYVGLLEFGGTVKGAIKPTRAKALSTPWGPRGAVYGDRTYRPRAFMRGAVLAKQTQIAYAIRDEVIKAFDGFEVHK